VVEQCVRAGEKEREGERERRHDEVRNQSREPLILRGKYGIILTTK